MPTIQLQLDTEAIPQLALSLGQNLIVALRSFGLLSDDQIRGIILASMQDLLNWENVEAANSAQKYLSGFAEHLLSAPPGGEK